MDRLFRFEYIFSTPDEIFGPYSTVYFIVFALGTIVANFFYFYGKYRFKDNLLTYTLINRASRNASIAFSLGFVFFLCRIVRLQPFNARIFLDVALILLLYYIVRGIGYMLRTYPKAKAEWQARKERLAPRREKKEEPKPAPAPVRPATPAKVTTTGTLASGSGDAGGDEDDIEPGTAVPPEMPKVSRQGLSERGQKRRERKRSKR